MTQKAVTMYAFRHRATGRFFRFEQLNDDGYGQYVADVTNPDSDEMPAFFAEHTCEHMIQHQGGMPVYGLRRPNGTTMRDNCERKEVELVEFTLSW